MRLKLTARCLIVNDGKLLVQVSRRGSFYKLPGGKLQPRETIIDTLRREMREELGLTLVDQPRLVAVVDAFYRDRGTVVREIGFYFLCSVEGKPVPREDHLEVKWVSISDDELSKLKPPVLADVVKSLGSGNGPLYLVSVEL